MQRLQLRRRRRRIGDATVEHDQLKQFILLLCALCVLCG
jgi:hypothetical protein